MHIRPNRRAHRPHHFQVIARVGGVEAQLEARGSLLVQLPRRVGARCGGRRSPHEAYMRTWLLRRPAASTTAGR